MRRERLRIFLICLILLLSFLTAGCWNYREINHLGFVLAAGIDPSKQGILLTVQTSNAAALSKQGTNASKFFTFTSTGETYFDAVRKITHVSAAPDRLFWPPSKVFVINEEVAKQGIVPYLEFSSRDAEVQRNLLLIVTPDRTADLLRANVKTEEIPGLAIFDLLEGYKATSTTVKINLNNFLRTYHSSRSALLPTVRLVNNQGKEKGYYISGSAVFKKDKLVGYLTPIETRGVLWAQGEVKSGIIVTKCPHSKGNKLEERISFETLRSSTKIRAEKHQNEITIHLKIKESGNLAEGACVQEEVLPPNIDELENLKKEKIITEVQGALEKAQNELHADVFGFGEVIHRTYPKEWKSLKQNWDQVFSTLKVNVEVETKITGNALIQRQRKKGER